MTVADGDATDGEGSESEPPEGDATDSESPDRASAGTDAPESESPDRASAGTDAPESESPDRASAGTDAPDSDALVRPDPGTARDRVAAAVEVGEMVTVFGRCTVDYEGRAASTLGPGDRLVVLKPDGTALVHTDEGQKPVNWQPPGCSHEVEVADGRFRIRSLRTAPEEELVVAFERVDRVAAFDVTDGRDLALEGTEADLRRRVLDDPDLVEPGFQPLATERETAAGAVDVYGEDSRGATVVVELKRKRVGPDAVGQLARYVEALDRDLHADAEVRGILVAPSVTERARTLLAEKGLEFVSLGPPE